MKGRNPNAVTELLVHNNVSILPTVSLTNRLGRTFVFHYKLIIEGMLPINLNYTYGPSLGILPPG